MSEKRDLDSVLAEVKSYIERKVAQGFDTPEDIEREAIEVFSEEADVAEIEEAVGVYTTRAISDHRKAERTWPAETECDRLDAAFKQLEESGIVARQNFTCCGTCGSAEIGDEIQQAQQRRLTTRGYTFYHMQDTEAAADGYGLYLAYGNVEQTEADAIRIGHEIISILERYDFKPSWDGTWNSRIFVPIKWQRRFRLARDGTA